MKNKKIIEVLKNYFAIAFGTAISSYALDVFLRYTHIAPGGISALSVMINDAVPALSVGAIMALINLPLFLTSFKMNKDFFIKSIFGAACYSVFVDIFAELPGLTDDLIIAAIFGGALMGLGFGIVFFVGGSSGGTDIAGWLIKRRFPNLRLSRAILILDVVVITLQGIVYGDITLCMYAAIAMFLSARVIDYVLEGSVVQGKTAYIISEKTEEISKRIIIELHRGVTALNGTGMYTGEEKKVLLTTVYRKQLPVLKKIIKEIDPTAFVIFTDVREVLGEGFNSIT